MKVLAGGGAALVEWRLETGRTHQVRKKTSISGIEIRGSNDSFHINSIQIRVHARYLGIPLLGDELYGGTKSLALSLLKSKNPNMYHSSIAHMVSKLQRPCLHAVSIG